MDSNGFMTESAHTFLKAVALEAKKNGGGRPQALAQWRARISAAIVWERASQLFRRQRDASLAHLTLTKSLCTPGDTRCWRHRRREGQRACSRSQDSTKYR